MPTMHSSPAVLILLLMAAGAATWSSFFLVAGQPTGPGQPLPAHQTWHGPEHHQPAHAAGRSCIRRERDALLAFKQGISDPYHHLESWQPERHDCCRWAGITCSNTTGHVIQLDLGETIFTTGTVPPQLGNLSKLEYLDLSYTMMYPADISWLTRLPQLVYLDMSGNNLSSIPSDWPRVVNMLPSLEHLGLSYCSLSSANHTPTHLNLTNLQHLDLSGNYFGHPIASAWFWNVTSITYLDLSQTSLHGPFPNALGNMTSLTSLRFIHVSDYRSVGGATTMAVDLKNLCDLENLSLDQSLSFGNITEFLDNLPQCSSNRLRHLSMHNNNMVGIIPNNMGQLTSLFSIDLSGNKISGAIPLGIGNFTYLEHLGLSNNLLSGHVPSSIGRLSNLIKLDLSNNKLDGEITEEHLVNLKNLEYMDLSNNNFSGTLPLEFGAQGLLDLTMSFNYFSGHIPESICHLKNLLALDLSNNFLGGELPQCSQGNSLVFLFLNNNNFSGEFPSTLQNYSSLAFIDLSRNNFCGTLPLWIGDFTHLIFLQLNHNLFHGEIPETITNLNELRTLNLAGNSLSGVVPWSLSYLTGMSSQNQDQNILIPNVSKLYTGRERNFTEVLNVVMKRIRLKYGAIFFLTYSNIDLSLNQLVGEIPDGVTSINGRLNLNLSWNHLSGKIPTDVGDMGSIESLDLSRNNLSGEIPSSLSDLTYLSCLDLSYNNLIGRIPPGAQLDTLYMENPSIYAGNIGLCGPPLGMNCSGDSVPEHGNQQRSGKVSDPLLFLYFGLGSGFVAGLWVVFCTLLFEKSWRITYFRLVDKVYDNAYVFVVVTWSKINGKTTS